VIAHNSINVRLPARAECASATAERSAARKQPGTGRSVERPLQQPAAFKAAIYAKGWSLKALAERWGMTPDGLLKVARDGNRPLHFDDAVRGLRKIGPPIKPRRAWSAALAGEPVLTPLRAPGLRYRGYFVVGAVVAVIKSVGSIAEEGMRGIVVEVVKEKTRELYRVLFETGDLELFGPNQVDEHLQDVGLVRRELLQFRYVNDVAVDALFRAGQFQFW
jgi:hypothetical protein